MCNETREPIHYGAGERSCISGPLTAGVNAEKRGDGRSKASKRAWGRVAERRSEHLPCETERLEEQRQERQDKESVSQS